MHFNHLDVEKQAGDKLVISGYVERDEDMAALRAKLDRQGFPNVNIEAKSGTRIAADLREALRMKSVHATTQWKGEGVVEISGRFGNQEKLDEALVSRVVTEYNQKLNLKAQIKNLAPERPEVKPVPDSKRIRRIVEGDDPYLEAADKSVIYKGGVMPSGDVFLGLEGDDVLVRDPAGNVQHRTRESVLDAKSS